MATVSTAQSGRWDGASYISADTKHQSQTSSLPFTTSERVVMSLAKTSARESKWQLHSSHTRKHGEYPSNSSTRTLPCLVPPPLLEDRIEGVVVRRRRRPTTTMTTTPATTMTTTLLLDASCRRRREEDGIEGGHGRDILDPPLRGFIRRHGNAVIVVIVVVVVVVVLLLLAAEARRGPPFGRRWRLMAASSSAILETGFRFQTLNTLPPLSRHS